MLSDGIAKVAWTIGRGPAVGTEFRFGWHPEPLLPALRFILPPLESLPLWAFCARRIHMRRHEFHVGT